MTSFVKVVQNVLGQSVFSVKLAGQSDFVVQPDLSFNAGDVYTFDVSDPSMSGYSFVFGTEVDVASSIVTTYTTVNGTTIALNIPGDYTGGALYYFDNTNAGMGYVEYMLTSNLVTEDLSIHIKAKDANEILTTEVTNYGDASNISIMGASSCITKQNVGNKDCFYLDISGWLQLPYIGNGGDLENISFSAMIYLPTNVFHWCRILNGATHYIPNIGSEQNYQVFTVSSGNGNYENVDISYNTWYHLGVIYDSNANMKLYINGAIERTKNNHILTLTDNVTKYTQPLEIGHTITYNNRSNFYFYDYRLYNRSITHEEMVEIYNKMDSQSTVYNVTVSGDPDVFYIDGSANPNLTFTPYNKYIFDQSDPSNAGHTLVITSAVDSSVNLINYQTLYGTPGQPGAYTTFTATSDTVSYVSYEVYASVPSLPAPVGDVYEVASISADVNDDTKTGTTPALKRTFTRNAVTNMLNQYKTQLTGNKALKLAAGTKLPGFDIPATKEITLRDARVTKTYTRDEMANKTTYMVLNDNDPVTLKSAADDTVTVTQSGTNFTVVTPAGTTNKVAGDTFQYDGLSLQFGSLVVNLLLIPPVDLALTAFDSAFVLTQQAILPDVSYTLDVSAEITLTQQISAADLSGVFFFKTDEDITSELVTDTSNVEYYLDRSQFTGGQATLNAMNGLVTTGYYGSNTNDHLGKDFLRDMAHQLFSTHFGVDLFTNEDAVITDISGKSAVVATDIFDKMGNVDKTNTALSGPDVSYGYYTTDTDSSNTNLTREILNQLLTLAPGRFTDKTTLRLDGSIPGVYGMPFVTNDTISYKLSVTAHASQNTTIATGKPGLGTRTYKVIFKVL